jgi:acyl dehydratase
VGFPGIIAHGMFSLAHLVKAVKDWAVNPAVLRSITVQFRAVVYMDETLVAKGKVAALDPESKDVTLDVWAEVERDGDVVKAIKNSRAVVNLA